MKIIFLDIDGVLNSRQSFKKTRQEYPGDEIRYDTPHPDHIQELNFIVKHTNAKVVISSTWRTSFSSLAMHRFLRVLGFVGDVIDNTPRLDTYRGTEIQSWLLAHESKIKKYKDSNLYNYEPIETFVILDDDSDMENLSEYLVQTSNDVGLTHQDAIKAVEILNKI